MKFIIILALLLAASNSFAAPFLVGDISLAEEITEVICDINGIEHTAIPEGGVFKLDLAGKFTWGDNVAKCKALNFWGESGWSDPLDFTASLPGVPSGLNLSVE